MARTYEFGLTEPSKKAGLLAGMSMTEKQGGSDVRAISSTATALSDGSYRIVGHKWYTSAPMNDLFLTLAQAPGGLTCFVLPRVLPDGSRNPIRLQRLKDKLGNRSNASAEIEYAGAIGWRLGDEGQGVKTIIDMVSMTRLDCVLGSAALTRAALTEAAHHVAHREAFGSVLAGKPLMQTVIADLALESEAATALGLRLAGAVDRGETDLLRLALPASKYLVCKRTPTVVAEALECLGGNGYVEEGLAARIYREMPLNAIWEGSGNVMALDLLRVLQREPETAAIVMEDLAAAAGGDAHLKAQLERVQRMLHEPRLLDRRGRMLTEALATLAAGTILRAHAPAFVADAFLATRLSGSPRHTYGQGLDAANTEAIVERAFPG